MNRKQKAKEHTSLSNQVSLGLSLLFWVVWIVECLLLLFYTGCTITFVGDLRYRTSLFFMLPVIPIAFFLIWVLNMWRKKPDKARKIALIPIYILLFGGIMLLLLSLG